MSTEAFVAFSLGLACGGLVGALAAFQLAWRMFLSKPPTIEMKADRVALASMAACNVAAWLDENGLVMMPKGEDFKAKVGR